jgi:hypothetical protein
MKNNIIILFIKPKYKLYLNSKVNLLIIMDIVIKTIINQIIRTIQVVYTHTLCILKRK